MHARSLLTPGRSLATGCALLALVAVASPATASAKAKPKTKAKPDVSVMSRNLYLGADIIKLVGATSVEDEKTQVQKMHETVDATDPPARLKAIAKEIAKTKPDIIGLQEVARYYRSADATPGQVADKVLYDYVAILQKELKALKQSYKNVVEQTEMDITVPSAQGYNLRLKLGNAVFVRGGKGATVKVTKKLKGNFKTQLKVALPSTEVALTRGYAGIDATVAGKAFRFLDPHAEAYGDALSNGQMKELLATAAASKTRRTIIAGDLNSDPAKTGENAYNTLIGAGFVDTGKRVATCCQNETVNNPTSELTTWIDHIIVRPKATVLSSKVFGNKPSDRLGSLWPSDHAGVIAKIRLK